MTRTRKRRRTRTRMRRRRRRRRRRRSAPVQMAYTQGQLGEDGISIALNWTPSFCVRATARANVGYGP